VPDVRSLPFRRRGHARALQVTHAVDPEAADETAAEVLNEVSPGRAPVALPVSDPPNEDLLTAEDEIYRDSIHQNSRRGAFRAVKARFPIARDEALLHPDPT